MSFVVATRCLSSEMPVELDSSSSSPFEFGRSEFLKSDEGDCSSRADCAAIPSAAALSGMA